jgi:excisionase family DNA binding protein
MKDNEPTKETRETLVYSVPEAGRLLSLSRATAYSLASQGTLPTIRLGRRLVVPRKALEELLQSVSKPKDPAKIKG